MFSNPSYKYVELISKINSLYTLRTFLWKHLRVGIKKKISFLLIIKLSDNYEKHSVK